MVSLILTGLFVYFVILPISLLILTLFVAIVGWLLNIK